MLIISRKINEAFIIGDDVEVVILDAQNDKIRIGISAPKHVQILRKELYETKKSNEEAVGSIDKEKFNALKNVIKKQKDKNT